MNRFARCPRGLAFSRELVDWGCMARLGKCRCKNMMAPREWGVERFDGLGKRVDGLEGGDSMKEMEVLENDLRIEELWE